MNSPNIYSFMKRTLAMLFMCLGLLILFGYFLEYRFSNDRSDKFIWLQDISNESFDYAYIGSSRALNMVDINQIDQKTNTKGVNLGMGGADYRTLYMILNSFTEGNNNKLKKIFLQIDPFMLYKDSVYNKPNYDHYFYKYADQEEIASCFNGDDKLFWYRYLPILKYVEYNKVYNITHFFRSFSENSKYDQTKGSSLITKHLPFVPDESLSEARLNVNEEDLFYLEKLLDFTKEKGIETILYTAPIYNYETTLKPAYPEYEKLVMKYKELNDLSYYDFRNQYLSQANLYKDKIHLNKEASEAFTGVMIKKMFQEK